MARKGIGTFCRWMIYARIGDRSIAGAILHQMRSIQKSSFTALWMRGRAIRGQAGAVITREIIRNYTARVIVHRILRENARKMEMDRLKEKLTRAAGVVRSVTDAIERDADKLIAREEELTQRRLKAFKPHHDLLESHNRDLDQLEDALQIVSNGAPLPDSEAGSPEVGQAAPGNFHEL